MVVEIRLRPRRRTARDVGDFLKRVGGEMFAHVLAGHVPDGEQNALPLVVAGTVLMGLPEIAQGDRSVNRRDDLRDPNLGGISRQDVATPDSAL